MLLQTQDILKQINLMKGYVETKKITTALECINSIQSHPLLSVKMRASESTRFIFDYFTDIISKSKTEISQNVISLVS